MSKEIPPTPPDAEGSDAEEDAESVERIEIVAQTTTGQIIPSSEREPVPLEPPSPAQGGGRGKAERPRLELARDPLASGTSGMKGPINGCINLSILDGWWVECYHSNPASGWAIGTEQEFNNDEYQDHMDSESLFELLEKEVIPEFYDRGADNLPRRWIARMKQSIHSVCSMFNTSRMVQQYAENAYMPASNLCVKLINEHGKGAKDLAKWKDRVASDWDKVWIFDVKANDDEPMMAGTQLEVQANVSLGPLTPDEVTIELYHGPLDASGSITHPQRSPMAKTQTLDKKAPEYPIHTYIGKVTPHACGQQGFAVRVLPKHPNVELRMEPGLIRWS